MVRSITNIFSVGLIMASFYEVIIRMFPYLVVMSPNTRAPKEMIVMLFSCIIGMLGLHYGMIKKIDNKWILIFVVYVFISIFNEPHFPFVINRVMSPNFWHWKPFVQILTFLLMFTTIQSVEFNEKDCNRLFLVLSWCGVVMALYIIFQSVGLEQFFTVKSVEEIGLPMEPLLGGTLGNSTIASAYICLLVPFALMSKSYFKLFFMIIAILLCKSDASILVLAFILLIFSLQKSLKFTVVVIVLLIVSCLIMFKVRPVVDNPMFNNNGRLDVWSKVIKDSLSKKYGIAESPVPITGVGVGSFPYLWSDDNKSSWKYAHNEYIESYFQLGVIGLLIILMVILSTLSTLIINWGNPFYNASAICFVGALIFAAVTFIFQMNPISYISVFCLGIINNKSLQRRQLL